MKNSKVLLAAILMMVMVIAVAMLLHNDKQRRAKTRASKPPPVRVAQAAKPARSTTKMETSHPTPSRRPPRNEARSDMPPPGARRELPAPPPAGAPVMVVIPPMPPADGADKAVPAIVAREALRLVGADPVAESIWIDAINNPALPAADRKNLIEDLNEAGFADLQNLKPEELPLVQHRIALIEKLAPTAMDDVNAAAFAEAYKDLKNMAARLAQPPSEQPQQ